jgi:hypothetical protein
MGVREALRHPWLTGLMVLSVALGVAVVVAIDLANASASRAFRISTEAVVGRATHIIQGGPSGIPEAVYRDLRVTGGNQLHAPIVEGYAVAEALGGQTARPRDRSFAEAPFRPTCRSDHPRIQVRCQAARAGLMRCAFFTRPGAGADQYQRRRAVVSTGSTFVLWMAGAGRSSSDCCAAGRNVGARSTGCC